MSRYFNLVRCLNEVLERMSRYSDLGRRLDEILEKRRKLCGKKDPLALVPLEGNESEWERLTKEAEDIRREMRRVRYGEV